MPQLDPTWFASQLFWLAVLMAVLHVLLSRAILPSLLKALEARDAARSADLSRAQALKDEAEQVMAAYERTMADARGKAQALFVEAEQKSRKASDVALADLSRKIGAETAEAERRISASKATLLKQLEPSVSELSRAIVDKLASSKVTTLKKTGTERP
jgi:F-type H+-transporting ATPase subunit b